MSSSLVGDMSFEFSFPSMEGSSVPPLMLDPCLLEIPSFTPGHARSGSCNSVFSNISQASTTATEVSVATNPAQARSSRPPTPPTRCSPPIRQHGPILLPKIRSQDQAIQTSAIAPVPKPSKKQRSAPGTPSPTARAMSGRGNRGPHSSAAFHPVHTRSFTSPEPIVNFNMTFTPPPEDQITSSLLSSPGELAHGSSSPSAYHSRASVDGSMVERYGYPTYRHMPTYHTTTAAPSPSMSTGMSTGMIHPHADAFMFPSMSLSKAPSPLSLPSSIEPIAVSQPQATTTLLTYLGAANPAPSLVRTLSFPVRDPSTKHFWWDVRQVRPWAAFTAQNILSMPGALATLTAPVPLSFLSMPAAGTRHPETEAQLHSVYASHYIPRLNAALAVASAKPLQFALPAKPFPGLDNLIIAHVSGDSASAAAIFGGKPSARIVGLVRSFDRFNTGMRVEGNIKRVEYLRGLAALHHAMREHSCRFGFILTEIELVVVRNGIESTPHFGHLEVSSVQLAATGSDGSDEDEHQLTACLALWGLGQMASMDAQTAAQNGIAAWKAEIGAPAEGTRRKTLARDTWMPQPQLAEKREAKRARGWIWPEDPVGRKELGKRGVRYGSC